MLPLGCLKLVDEVVAIQAFYRIPVFALPITSELYIVVRYSIDRFLANYSIKRSQVVRCHHSPENHQEIFLVLK